MFDTEKFIKVVQSRPCLWDVSSADYQNRFIKNSAWEEVGREMHADWNNLSKEEKMLRGKILEKKWKNIKDCFARELKLQKTRKSDSGKETGIKRKYLYFKQLLFLMPAYLNRREKKNSHDLTWEAPDEYSAIDCHQYSSNDGLESSANPAYGQDVEDVQIKYEPRSDCESEETTAHYFRDSNRLDDLDGHYKGSKGEENSDVIFGRSIATEMSLFKECREKRILKAKIYQLLAEYEGPVNINRVPSIIYTQSKNGDFVL